MQAAEVRLVFQDTEETFQEKVLQILRNAGELLWQAQE